MKAPGIVALAGITCQCGHTGGLLLFSAGVYLLLLGLEDILGMIKSIQADFTPTLLRHWALGVENNKSCPCQTTRWQRRAAHQSETPGFLSPWRETVRVLVGMGSATTGLSHDAGGQALSCLVSPFIYL